MRTHLPSRLVAGVASLLALSLAPAACFADTFTQTNLISNISGLAATTDSNLVNPWGMSFTATSPFWISDQGTNNAILTDGAGNLNALVVTIPSGGPPSGPTGQVANGTTSFVVSGTTTPAHFIFDTLQGTIAAWASGTTAVTEATTPGAVYTGLAIGSTGGNNYLYAADSGTGVIRVFNSAFAPTTLSGHFTDPGAIAGYVPYNIQLIGSNLYVTYANLGARGVPIPGSGGFVDVFDTAGNFLQRLATNGPLFAPWGITQAPSTFGSFGNDFLIGNFGNGEIDAYSAAGILQGALDGTNGLPLVESGLWALDFRTGGANDDPNALYFTAGINNQADGLFGDITPPTPQPPPDIHVRARLQAHAHQRPPPPTDQPRL